MSKSVDVDLSGDVGVGLTFDNHLAVDIPTSYSFDITNIPCAQASAAPGAPSTAPVCSPNAGLFAFMIISTYQRGASATLTGWVDTNGKDVSMAPDTVLSPIQWGDSSEAYKMDDGRRIALTPHHVVILKLSSGVGLLDLEAEMSARLATWKFTF